MNDKPISRKANIVVQDLETEVLIYDLSINKAYCLNQTSGLVFQLCDGKRTIAEISDLMSRELKTLFSEDFVWLTLNELKKDGLLENADELTNHFAGLTRREVVKRVGLASMVMLPLISSVVAPSAVFAQSCASGTVPNGGGCTLDFQCISCCCATSTPGTPGTCAPLATGGPGDTCVAACQCAAGLCAPNPPNPRICN